ncbi:MAG: hypothetical protein PHO08_15480 [Methylococcales bacterium]|nr:hypothetical protein [Methylococcales bacterium]MDD5631274.1 hypothetical protein [Methylococcales bacterium]
MSIYRSGHTQAAQFQCGNFQRGTAAKFLPPFSMPLLPIPLKPNRIKNLFTAKQKEANTAVMTLPGATGRLVQNH